MKLAITQPTYLPWLGFFDMLDVVDLWIPMDNVQLSRRSFHVRNRIKSPDDRVAWLTVNLKRCPRETHLSRAEVSDTAWRQDHWNKLCASYAKARYFGQYEERLRALICAETDRASLSHLTTTLTLGLCDLLGVAVETRAASTLLPELRGSAQDKVMSLCDIVCPAAYYNFQGGVEAGLYDPVRFRERGVAFFKHEYRHPEYHQLGAAFTAYLSVVDLIFNEGPAALEIIRAGSRWVELT